MPTAANIYDAIVALVTPTIPIGAEYVGQIALPFARYVELGQHHMYFTKSAADTSGTQVWSDGGFQVSVFASSREQARLLGLSVMNIVNGASLTYSDGRKLLIEPTSMHFVPEPHTGPATPTVFHFAIHFSFAEQRAI